MVVYSVAEGWSIVEDPDGADLSATLPSWGSGLLATRAGSADLVRFDATGASDTVTLPEGARPVAGIGDAVFAITAAGEPAVIQP